MAYNDGVGTAGTAPNHTIASGSDDMATPTGKRTTSPAPYAWRTLSPFYESAPRVGGCYAFYFNGVLSYVGQTQNLYSRLRSHDIRPDYGNEFFTPWGTVQDVIIKIKVGRRFGEWAMREQRLIRRLRPMHNSRIG
jgi:hypothetical protein